MCVSGFLFTASLGYNVSRSCDEFGFWQVAAPADQPSLVSRQYDVASNEVRLVVLATTPTDRHISTQRTCGYFFPDAFTGPQNSSSFLKALAVNKAYGGWNVTTERLVFVNGERESPLPPFRPGPSLTLRTQWTRGATRRSARSARTRRGRRSGSRTCSTTRATART